MLFTTAEVEKMSISNMKHMLRLLWVSLVKSPVEMAKLSFSCKCSLNALLQATLSGSLR